MSNTKRQGKTLGVLQALASAFLALALAAALPGCAGGADPTPADAYSVDASAISAEGIEPTDTVIVCATVRGQAFRIPDTAFAYAKAAVQGERYVGVVLADGSPSVNGLRYGLTRNTEAGRAKEVRANAQDYIDYACSLRGSEPGVRVLESINSAASELHAKGSGDMTIIVVTSGLTDDAAPTTHELLSADPAQIVDQLVANGSIADYSAITVRFYGIGQSTGEQAIPDSTAVALKAFWGAVIVAGGGEPVFCTDVLVPLGSDPALPGVRLFEFPPDSLTIPELAPSQTVDLVLSEDVLTFVGDSDEFYDESQADRLLERVAGDIVSGGYCVEVSGYTADSPARSAEFLQDLSERRARAVARELIRRGVPEQSILEVRGFGPEGSTSMATGTFDEDQAKRDRRVVLRISACLDLAKPDAAISSPPWHPVLGFRNPRQALQVPVLPAEAGAADLPHQGRALPPRRRRRWRFRRHLPADRDRVFGGYVRALKAPIIAIDFKEVWFHMPSTEVQGSAAFAPRGKERGNEQI